MNQTKSIKLNIVNKKILKNEKFDITLTAKRKIQYTCILADIVKITKVITFVKQLQRAVN